MQERDEVCAVPRRIVAVRRGIPLDCCVELARRARGVRNLCHERLLVESTQEAESFATLAASFGVLCGGRLRQIREQARELTLRLREEPSLDHCLRILPAQVGKLRIRCKKRITSAQHCVETATLSQRIEQPAGLGLRPRVDERRQLFDVRRSGVAPEGGG